MVEPDMAKVAELRDWILTGVVYSAERREAVLKLEHWDGRRRSVTLEGVVQLNISGMPDESGPSDVIGAKAEQMEEGGRVALEMFGHSFRRGESGVVGYPGTKLTHLELVGDLCVNAVCQRIRVFEV
ncbi:MAG TPA: hypothetical protein VFZ27_05670 [Terriglobia bacterium]|nr:hypothetical protein [Terriglobia bacterium]